MSRRLFIAMLAGALMLAGCTGGSGGSVDTMRQMVRGGQSAPTTPTPSQIGAPIQPTEQPAQTSTIVEVTRVVEVTRQTTQLQPVEVTRVVEVVITPTPDIQGFSAPAQIGADESMQPCPLKYWRKGRCTATQAQLERAASEVQP